MDWAKSVCRRVLSIELYICRIKNSNIVLRIEVPFNWKRSRRYSTEYYRKRDTRLSSACWRSEGQENNDYCYTCTALLQTMERVVTNELLAISSVNTNKGCYKNTFFD